MKRPKNLTPEQIAAFVAFEQAAKSLVAALGGSASLTRLDWCGGELEVTSPNGHGFSAMLIDDHLSLCEVRP